MAGSHRAGGPAEARCRARRRGPGLFRCRAGSIFPPRRGRGGNRAAPAPRARRSTGTSGQRWRSMAGIGRAFRHPAAGRPDPPAADDASGKRGDRADALVGMINAGAAGPGSGRLPQKPSASPSIGAATFPACHPAETRFPAGTGPRAGRAANAGENRRGRSAGRSEVASGTGDGRSPNRGRSLPVPAGAISRGKEQAMAWCGHDLTDRFIGMRGNKVLTVRPAVSATFAPSVPTCPQPGMHHLDLR
jgi:hypothetical protein